MATLKALAALGQSIVADIADAKDATVAAVQRARAERKIVRDFKAMLREEPLALAKAIALAAEQPAKPARKPRAKKAAQK